MENKTTYKIAREVANQAEFTRFELKDGGFDEGLKFDEAVEMAVEMAAVMRNLFVAEACDWLKKYADYAFDEGVNALDTEKLAGMFAADNAMSKADAEEIAKQRRFNEVCSMYRSMRRSVENKSLEEQRDAINKFRAGEWRG